MPSTLTSNLQTGGAQYQTAIRNSQNAVSSLLNQAGIIMPGGGAASGVGGAFDPYNMISGTMSPEDLAKTIAGTSYGAEGAYSEAYQAGGNIAAEQAMQSRSRGLGGGGLAAQRQELALMQTQGGAADVTKGLVQGLGEQYGISQQANLDEIQRRADAKTAAANLAAERGTITNPNLPTTIISVADRANYTKKGTPRGSDVPKNPKPGQPYKGDGGVSFVYRPQGPKGPGWYTKGSNTAAGSGPGPIIPPGTTGI